MVASVFLFGLAATTSSAASPALPQADPGGNIATSNSWPHDLVNGLVNLEFSDHHLTPRGINLQDEGLVFQPYVRLDWNLYDAHALSSEALDQVTFTTAVWNDLDTVASGVDPGHWNEIDFIAGPNATIYKNWTIESPFIGYKSETGSFPMCWAWNPKLTYHDNPAGHFSVNPYAEFFVEMENKITVVFAPETSQSSYYGVIGMTPAYVFERLPLKLESPTYILIPGADFYQRKDGSGGGTDLALFTTAIKATIPLNVIGSAWGKWSVYAGIQYDYLNNPGLLDGNEATGVGNGRDHNIFVLHGGMTVRF